jgi:hypothetical protein
MQLIKIIICAFLFVFYFLDTQQVYAQEKHLCKIVKNKKFVFERKDLINIHELKVEDREGYVEMYNLYDSLSIEFITDKRVQIFWKDYKVSGKYKIVKRRDSCFLKIKVKYVVYRFYANGPLERFEFGLLLGQLMRKEINVIGEKLIRITFILVPNIRGDIYLRLID